ncbi:MAG TPA: glycosyltransferase family 39 protein [Terriglobales bacterium]|nr:glycosyltransferase family 39 protein [Terriglobales bacterium]
MRRHWPIFALLTIAAIAYLLYPSRIPECDAVIYASAALRGVREMTFYPGHLGYGPLENLSASLGRWTRPPLNPLFILQYLSMAAALVAAWAFHRALEALGVGRARAVLFTAILAASYAWWHFALQAESHMLSTALLMIFLWQTCRTLAKLNARSWAWAGLWLGLATLIHQKNILFAAAALPALAVPARDFRRVLREEAAFFGTLAIVVIVPYLVVGVGVLGLRTSAELMLWIRGLSTWSAWGHWSRATVPGVVVGLARSFVGSHFLLRVGPIHAAALRLFPRASFEDEFAIAASIPAGVGVALMILEVPLLALAGLALVRRIVRPGIPGPRGLPLSLFLWAWIAAVVIFAAWWAPVRAEFWIDLFPPVLVLLALLRAGARDASAGSRLIAYVAVALALVNFIGSIRPQSMAALEPESSVALALDAAVKPGDIVISDSPFTGRASRYARTFEPVDLMGAECALGDAAEPARVRLVDSILVGAERAHRSAYLAVTPLGTADSARAAYRRATASLAEHFETGERIAIRAGLDLRRLRRRAPAER